MMTFEDIVDMDWLDSHSIKGEPMDLFPNDYVDYNHYLNADLLSPKLEHASSPPPLLLASSPPPTYSSMFHPSAAASCSAAAAIAAATTTPPPPLTFPTTEQIKQLIELAKHQLALRAAQTSSSNSSNNSSSNRSTNTSNDATDNSTTSTPSINASTEDKVLGASINSAPTAAAISTVSTSTTSQLAAHLANTSLFASDNNSNLPDTVSPESLMKSTTSARTTSSNPSASIPSSSLKAVKIEKDTAMTSSLLSSPASDDDEEEMYKKPSRRSSLLLADEVRSLEAYAESDGIDMKKLSPRERRQLRNKISARNFRVRRKEYITTLEQQVNDHKKHAENLAEQLCRVSHENTQLREQVDTLKRQNLLLSQHI